MSLWDVICYFGIGVMLATLCAGAALESATTISRRTRILFVALLVAWPVVVVLTAVYAVALLIIYGVTQFVQLWLRFWRAPAPTSPAAYDKGCRAYVDGWWTDSCPFTSGTPEADDWLDGWHDTQEEDSQA